jgi:DNA-binding NarL/FixJ family response regulator
MDLAMPLAGGFSAAHSIRNSGASAKILFFTTRTLGELERMSRKAGFEGFVCKTNAAHDLLRGVRAVLVGNEFYNSEVIQARSA